MSNTELNAELRTEFGKGAARRVRAAGRIPAVLYGHGADPVHLSLPGHEATLALRNPNALLELHYDGESQLALPRETQRHPIRRDIIHTDLLLVRRGEKVTVDVTVRLSGDVAAGGVLTQENATLAVEAEATSLPSGLDLDIEGMEIGTVVTAGEIALPEGVTLVTDAEAVVISVAAPQAEEEPTAEGAEAAEGEEPAEGAEGEESEAAEDE